MTLVSMAGGFAINYKEGFRLAADIIFIIVAVLSPSANLMGGTMAIFIKFMEHAMSDPDTVYEGTPWYGEYAA